MLKKTNSRLTCLTALRDDVIPLVRSMPDAVDFNFYINECGTMRCLFGYAMDHPAFAQFKMEKMDSPDWDTKHDGYGEAAVMFRAFLDRTFDEFDRVFGSTEVNDDLEVRARIIDDWIQEELANG